ncbi:MAG: hypothetical protein AB2L14_12655 [Candidatus Xenobiia bacterium LiM19]
MEETLKTGTLLKDTYEIRKNIYHGRLFNFYLAVDKKAPETTLQITEILVSRIPRKKDTLSEDGFNDAIDLLKQTSHIMLPAILDGFYFEGNAYIVLSHYEGISLDSLIKMNVSPLSVEETIDKTRQLISILKFFYDRPEPIPFIHIDPQHICVNDKGEMFLMGNGLHLYLDHYLSSTDVFAFCAPEIAEGTAFSEKSSVYTIAAIMYYMCTKKKWDGRKRDNPKPRNIEKTISESFQDVVMTGINRSQEYRYLNLDIMNKKLEDVLNPPEALHVEDKKPHGEAAFIKESRVVRKILRIAGIALGSLLILFLIFIFFTGPLFDRKSTTDSLFAYVLAEGGKSISQIDMKLGTNMKIIAIPGVGRDMVPSPDGRKLYLTRAEKNVTIIDTIRGAVSETFPLKFSPDRIMLSSDGTLAYISTEQDSFVTQWNTETHDSFEMPAASPQLSAVLSPDSDIVYAIGSEKEEVSVVDTKKKQFISTFPAGSKPAACTINKTGRYLIVASMDPSVSIFDTRYQNLTKLVTVEKGRKQVAATRNGAEMDYAYIACEENNVIYAVDLSTLAVMKKKESKGIPKGIATSPDGKTLYVLTSTPNYLTSMNARTLDIKKEIPTGLVESRSLIVWP